MGEPEMRDRFWCEYTPPSTHVAAEVQKPAYMVDGYTLAVAYQKDVREARIATRALASDGKE